MISRWPSGLRTITGPNGRWQSTLVKTASLRARDGRHPGDAPQRFQVCPAHAPFAGVTRERLLPRGRPSATKRSQPTIFHHVAMVTARDELEPLSANQMIQQNRTREG